MLKVDNLLSAFWLTGGRSAQFRIFTILRRMDDVRKEFSSVYEGADSFLQESIFVYDYQDEKASSAIDINTFYNLLEVERWGSFNGTRSNKTRYLLLKLDMILSNSNTQMSYNKTFSSIEHLMPQKIESKYWVVEEQDHKEWLHKLGNIVLIDRKKNSSMSNLDYESKKIKYQGAIESRANTNYIFMKYSAWTVDDISKNHERCVQLLKEYYDGNSLATLKSIRKKLNQLPGNMTSH